MVINIFILPLLKGHVKEGSMFIIPNQKLQCDSGAGVESAYK